MQSEAGSGGTCLGSLQAGVLTMVPFETQIAEQDNWAFGVEQTPIKKDAFSAKNVKASQFSKPYFEFSAACAGCAETPYIKLVTQLFGDRMYIANASGCSSAYGGPLPATTYCKDERGFGPSWEQSLFEENAEFGFGFLNAHEVINKEILLRVQTLMDAGVAKDPCAAYLRDKDESEKTRAASDALIVALEQVNTTDQEAAKAVKFILDNKELEGYHRSAEDKHPKCDRIKGRTRWCLQCANMTRSSKKKRSSCPMKSA